LCGRTFRRRAQKGAGKPGARPLDIGPDIEPRAVITDKGYSSKANRAAARARGIAPINPHKGNEKDKPAFFAKTLYKARARNTRSCDWSRGLFQGWRPEALETVVSSNPSTPRSKPSVVWRSLGYCSVDSAFFMRRGDNWLPAQFDAQLGGSVSSCHAGTYHRGVLIQLPIRRRCRSIRPSPSALLVAKSAIPSEGNWAGFWGNDAIDQKLYDIAATGPVALTPDLSKLKGRRAKRGHRGIHCADEYYDVLCRAKRYAQAFPDDHHTEEGREGLKGRFRDHSAGPTGVCRQKLETNADETDFKPCLRMAYDGGTRRVELTRARRRHR
jgi:hypothetical protein